MKHMKEGHKEGKKIEGFGAKLGKHKGKGGMGKIEGPHSGMKK